MDINESFHINPYEIDKYIKQDFLIECISNLVLHHYKKCTSYKSILLASGNIPRNYSSLDDIPFLPVRLFKEYDIKSITEEETIKTLVSSGTTGQKVSKIYLDKITAGYQTKALVNILQTFLGKQRLPMLIIDTENVIKDRKLFSARGVGILGISNFGRDHTYLLNVNMELQIDLFDKFYNKHRGERILIFGFTFMIWQYLYEELIKNGRNFDLSNAVLIHSGGWKKLNEKAIDNVTFKKQLASVTGLKYIYNFYGMVEQVGSIFMECEEGYFHTPIFSDIIIRDPITWGVQPFNTEGIIEVLSILPYSYPGHALLTEDVGIVIGEDDCACGRMGKYFVVKRRVPQAEIRGCSDTHAYGREVI